MRDKRGAESTFKAWMRGLCSITKPMPAVVTVGPEAHQSLFTAAFTGEKKYFRSAKAVMLLQLSNMQAVGA